MKERTIMMLTHPTLDQMQALGLAGMADAYRQLAEQDNAADLSRDEWLGLMLDREAAIRADRRLTNRLAAAKLRFVDACIEDIDFASRRGLDRRNTLQLAQGAWLKAHENLILTGQTGTGKTWLACAFGRQAARLDHSVLYLRVPRLFEDLAMARLDGRFPRLIDKLCSVAHSRRLGNSHPQRSATPRSPGNLRRALQAKIHPHHRAAARCPMA
jgi:DNA replication protein DnaC